MTDTVHSVQVVRGKVLYLHKGEQACSLAGSAGKKDRPALFEIVFNLPESIPQARANIFGALGGTDFLYGINPPVDHLETVVVAGSVEDTAVIDDLIGQKGEDTS